jgi:hypothetical protein
MPEAACRTLFPASTRIGARERRAVVAKPDMGDLHRDRHAVQHNDLVAPVEMEGLPARRRAAPRPRPSMARARWPTAWRLRPEAALFQLRSTQQFAPAACRLAHNRSAFARLASPIRTRAQPMEPRARP